MFTKEEVFDLYVNKEKSTEEIAKEKGCSAACVIYWLKKYGIPRRGVKEAQRIQARKNANVNIDFFYKESPELYYILGLWASDGIVYNSSLALDLTDKDVIDWVAETIGYKNTIKPIKKYGGFYNKTSKVTSIGYKIRFRSIEVADIFSKYGITERKSKIITFPTIPESMLPHFVRGVFDGDGGIYVAKREINGKYYDRATVHFSSGSFVFLEGLKGIIESVIGGNRKISKGTRCFQYSFEGKKDVIRFGEWIYQGDAFGMKRKKDKFLSLGVEIGSQRADAS